VVRKATSGCFGASVSGICANFSTPLSGSISNGASKGKDHPDNWIDASFPVTV
jgi:hypothetical protein